MRLIRQQASKAATAFPVGDAQGIRLNPVRSGQGLLGHERAQVKKLVRVRVGTLNVGTMTGRGRELADLMERRKVGVLCVQETRWKGDKAKELGGGCKLLCSGANKQGRNGVGIVISKDLKEDLISVSKRSDRVMSIKLGVEETVVNIICAYAPQVGCTEEDKETFWEQMDQELSATLDDERVIVGGDLNGHIGRSRDGIERIHGGWGMRDRNDEGEKIVDTAMAFDLAIVEEGKVR